MYQMKIYEELLLSQQQELNDQSQLLEYKQIVYEQKIKQK